MLGEEIQIGGYFIFYEQNEEMQAYMIAEREQNRPAAVEEERVMEAISARREKRKAEAAADAARAPGTPPATASGRLRRIQRLAGKRCCQGWVRLKLQRLR